MTDPELVRAGRKAILQNDLLRIRQRLGLSQNAMAEFLYVAPNTYKNWEESEAQPRAQAAERIARFVSNAELQLEWLADNEVNIGDLLPLNLAASSMGVPHEILLRLYRNGGFEAADLGLLGLWVHRSELNNIMAKVSE
jgi:transcriptional regulator with XRE-family HTH domain